MPDLSERDRAKFRQLRERLEAVEPAVHQPSTRPLELGPLDPMLSTPFEGELDDLDETAWIAERKYDGTRIILQHIEGELRAYTRRGINRIESIPAVATEAEDAIPTGTILDGEYVYLTSSDTSRFRPIHSTKDLGDLTPVLFCFDVLATDGDWVIDRPLSERKELLLEVVDVGTHIRPVSGREAQFQAFFDDLVERDEEGIMVKRRGGRYHPGIRSRHWQKVKAFAVADLLAVGYTAGSGTRADTFGALVLSDGETFRGKVGSGFTTDELTAMTDLFETVDRRPFLHKTVGERYTPIEPLVVQVRYQAITSRGTLRAPVFVKAKPDKPVGEVTPL